MEDRNVVMKRMQRQGHTFQEIGDAFGITRERVRQVLNRANHGVTLSCIKGGILKRKIDKAQKMFINEGITLSKIAKQLNINPAKLSIELRKKGIDTRKERGLAIPTRLCNFCNKKLPKEDFYYPNRARCKTCFAENQKELRAIRYQRSIDSLITCSKCSKEKLGTEFVPGYKQCRKCNYAYQAEWHKNKITKVVPNEI